jgi:small subunit ribosomal protein S6
MQLVRKYETLFIVRPETDDTILGRLQERLATALESKGGREIKFINWGKRKLSYEIDKHNKGVYLYYTFLGGLTTVAELERNLRNHDAVIRYQTVRLSELADIESYDLEAERRRAEALTPEREEDEEEIYLRRSNVDDDDDDVDTDDDDLGV